MGQSGSAAVVPGVDRAEFSEEQYQALRRTLEVGDDSPEARAELPAFLAPFPPHLRPLMQPVFFQLAREQIGEPSASWPVLVAGLSSLVSRGAAWSALLQAWAAGVAGEPADVELHVELAASLCFWCAHPGLRPGADADAALARLVAALTLAACAAAGGASDAADDSPGVSGSSSSAGGARAASASARLEAAAPCLPLAVGPCLACALLGASPPQEPPAPESRILDAGSALLLRGMDPGLWESGAWTPLYRDWLDGRSFNGLLKGALHYEGRAALLVRTSDGHVMGALSSTWADGNGKFIGSPECFLLSLAPAPAVFRSSSRTGNYVYLNSRNKFAPRGLGFGGQLNFHRLWLDADFESCYVMEGDATYANGPLLPTAGLQTAFHPSHIEIWGCGGDEALQAQAAQRERDQGQRDLARKVDRAKLVESEFDKEMFFGGTFKASSEAREEIERPGDKEGG